MWSAEPFSAPSVIIAPSYTGPGDLVASWAGWWGLRGYNSSYIGEAIRIVDSGGGNETSINILSGGALDTTTLSSWIASNGTASVNRLFDQSGNGKHLTQATVANMPTVNTSGTLSLVLSASVLVQTAASFTLAQPFSGAFVGKRVSDNDSANVGTLINGNSGDGIYLNVQNPNYKAGIAWGSSVVSTNILSVNTFIAINMLANGTSSKILANGTSDTGLNAGTRGFSSDPLVLWTNTTSDPMHFCEGGFVSGDQSSSFAALESNQRTYWGF